MNLKSENKNLEILEKEVELVKDRLILLASNDVKLCQNNIFDTYVRNSIIIRLQARLGGLEYLRSKGVLQNLDNLDEIIAVI